jgi:hypothetical protein
MSANDRQVVAFRGKPYRVHKPLADGVRLMTVDETATVDIDQRTYERLPRLVCPQCRVYCRKGRSIYDETGSLVQASTVCAYCGSAELEWADA